MASCNDFPPRAARRLLYSLLAALASLRALPAGSESFAQQAEPPQWAYSADLLRPFWEGTVMHGESVLFIRESESDPAKAAVLFPIEQVLEVRNSAGTILYEEGKDYVWTPGSREIVLPAGSRIASHTPQDLRRPAKSQKYELTHRDGNGEIFFGGRLEYAEMQTTITYRHAPDLWKTPVPRFDPQALPRTVRKLLVKEPVSIVVVGDSISAGCNASGWAGDAPFQPAYPELLRRHLQARFQGAITLHNPSVSGVDTQWVLGAIDKVVEPEPDLVIIAFGMNDAAGRPAQEYAANIAEVMARIRERRPEVEFILVATMLGNRDWVRLDQDLFPQYRDALARLSGPGIALADVTSIWGGILERKKDWDQSGNGVNHPNDWGHRIYTQVLSTLLVPAGLPDATPEPERTVDAGPLRFIESRLLGGYTYSYACAAADLDGDGDLDLTSADAEPNSNLYLLRNDGQGHFQHSFIQKYALEDEQPVRLERHAMGDVNGDGRPDVVIVDNLKWDIRWFENPGPEAMARPWPLRRVSAPQEVPGAYDVALADFDGDGDLDVAASSWRYGNRFDWFENVGQPGSGENWVRHSIEEMVGETRTIAVADFNGDGKPDLLGSSRTGNQIVWYANPGQPATKPWTKTIIDDTTGAPTHGHPVDMDGDGDLDVVMACGLSTPADNSPASHQIAWYENVGRPGAAEQWKKHSIAADFPQGFEAVAADLDQDGDMDVVATAWGPTGKLVWLENRGDPTGTWREHPLKTDWPRAVTVIVADLDHDGRLDIAACAERGANELRWWRNVGAVPAP